MNRSFDAIVIGAGAGGLTAGALLAQKGLKTIIFEKNNIIGGLCATLQEKGYAYDVAATQFRTSWYENVSKTLNLKINWSKPFQPFIVWKYDDFDVHIPLIAEKLLESFRKLGVSKEDLHEADKFLKMAKEFTFESATEKGLMNISMRDYFKGKITDERVIMVLSTINTWMLPPSQVSTGMALSYLWDYMNPDLGVYPMGGSKGIMEAYLKAFKDAGGVLEKNKRVEKIIVEGEEAKGIALKDGEKIASKIIVSTAGIKETMFNLLNGKYISPEYLKNVKNIKPVCPVFTVILGLDYKPAEYSRLMRFSYDLEDDYARTLNDELPKDPSYLWSVPSMEDSNLAPKGKHVMILTGMVQPVKVKRKSWDSVKEVYANSLIETVKRTSCPNIDKHIVFKKILTPEFYERWTGKKGGYMEGFAMTYDQAGRGPLPTSNIKGLYCISESMGYIGVAFVSDFAISTLKDIKI